MTFCKQTQYINDQLQPIFSDRTIYNAEYISQVAQVKRFVELWIADPVFRQETNFNANDLWQRYKLEIDPEVYDYIFNHIVDSSLSKQKSRESELVPLAIKRYSPFLTEIFNYRGKIRSDCASELNLDFQVWRNQQINRAFQEISKEIAMSLVYAPVCFELSRGCSVGCWFCALSAPKLEDIFLYTPFNSQLWKEVLQAVQDVVGVGAKYGFCYWASDPLDNPDYEQFCLDFYEIFGRFPGTTTALSIKNPERTRNLLNLSTQYQCQLNRFSILSLKSLKKLYAEFTAEELLFVEVILQNKESLTPKSLAGRAREYYLKQNNDSTNFQLNRYSSLTSACVSGFLINMVERSLKLISPCNADEQFPLGYRVYWEENFTTALDFQRLLQEVIAAQTPVN